MGMRFKPCVVNKFAGGLLWKASTSMMEGPSPGILVSMRASVPL